MSNLRTNVNLFYYNLYRFECFTQYLISYPIMPILRATGIIRTAARRSGKENFEEYLFGILNDPKGGISLNFAGIQVTAHLTVLLFSPWNILSGLLKIPIDIWPYGFIVTGLIAFVVSYYVAPDDNRKYLEDFRKFEKMSKARKRMYALLTFLIVIATWAIFIGSFIFMLRSLVQ